MFMWMALQGLMPFHSSIEASTIDNEINCKTMKASVFLYWRFSKSVVKSINQKK